MYFSLISIIARTHSQVKSVMLEVLISQSPQSRQEKQNALIMKIIAHQIKELPVLTELLLCIFFLFLRKWHVPEGVV